MEEFRALRGATAERGGSAKPFEKGLSENYSIGSSKLIVKSKFELSILFRHDLEQYIPHVGAGFEIKMLVGRVNVVHIRPYRNYIHTGKLA